jgi:hypothetical protein
MNFKLENKLGKNLKTLKTMKLTTKAKAELKKEAKRWIKFIQFHIEDMHSQGLADFAQYHIGEISFIEFFFNIKEKK